VNGDGDERDQHASRRSLPASPLPLHRQQLEPHRAARLSTSQKKRPVAVATGRLYVHVRMLKHAEYNRADEGECNIRGYNAKPADERTYEIHWEVSLGFTSCPQLTLTLAKRSPPKKSAVLSIQGLSTAGKPPKQGKQFVKSTC
jgi:hypothetical protein